MATELIINGRKVSYIYENVVPITASQFQSSNTTPILLTPTPASGYVISIVALEIDYRHNGTAYDTNTNLAVRQQGGASKIADLGTNILASISNQFKTATFYEGDVLSGVPIELYTENGDPLNGNGTAAVYVKYAIHKIVDTPGDVTPPTLTSTTIYDDSKDRAKLVFSENVSISTLGWSFSTDSPTPINITGVVGSGGNSPEFLLDREITDTETITISYNSGTGDTKDLAAVPNPLASITDATVTNQVLPVLAAPTNFVANGVSYDQIVLDWTDIANESNYQIDYSTDGGASYQSLVTLAANSVTYSHLNLEANQTVDYRIKALGDGANYSDSPYAFATGTTQDLPQLTAPTLTVSVISSSRLRASWDDVGSTVGYVLERSDDGSNWTALNSITLSAGTVSYDDIGLSSGKTRYYRVKALGDDFDNRDSPYSNVDSGTTSPIKLQTPQNFLATPNGTDTINLSWDNVANETGFYIGYSTDGGANYSLLAQVAADVTSYVHNGLNPGDTVYYQIKATGDGVAYSDSDFNIDFAQTDLGDTSNPQLLNAAITDANPDQLALSFSENVNITTNGWSLRAYYASGPNQGDPYGLTISSLLSGSGTSSPIFQLSASAIANLDIYLDYDDTVGDTVDTSTNNNPLVSFLDFIVSNQVVSTDSAVSVSSASLEDSNHSLLQIVFSGAIYTSLANFYVDTDAPTPIYVTGITGSGTTNVGLQLSRPVISNEVVTFTYKQSVGGFNLSFSATNLTGVTSSNFSVKGDAIDSAGDPLANITGQAVTNNITTELATPVVTVTVIDSTQLQIDWTNVANESGYTLEVSDDGSTGWTPLATKSPDVTTHTHSGLTPSTTKYYRVKADGDGVAYFDSAWSVVKSGTTQAGDTTKPTLSSAVIEGATPSLLNLGFSEAVDITTSGWSINTDSASPLSISSLFDGNQTTTPRFQLNRDVLEGENVTISYDAATGNTVDLAFNPNELDPITNYTVTIQVFNPGQVSVFWAAGRLEATAIDGNTMAAIKNQVSGGLDAVQATTAKKPIFRENIINGHPVYRADGVDDEMTFQTTYATMFQGNEWGFVFVGQELTIDANDKVYVGVTTGATTQIQLHLADVYKSYVKNQANDQQALASAGLVVATPTIIAYHFDWVNNIHRIRKNGVDIAFDDQNYTDIDPLQFAPGGNLHLFQMNGGSLAYHNMDLAEINFGNMSLTELQQCEDYYSNIYNI